MDRLKKLGLYALISLVPVTMTVLLNKLMAPDPAGIDSSFQPSPSVFEEILSLQVVQATIAFARRFDRRILLTAMVVFAAEFLKELGTGYKGWLSIQRTLRLDNFRENIRGLFTGDWSSLSGPSTARAADGPSSGGRTAQEIYDEDVAAACARANRRLQDGVTGFSAVPETIDTSDMKHPLLYTEGKAAAVKAYMKEQLIEGGSSEFAAQQVIDSMPQSVIDAQDHPYFNK